MKSENFEIPFIENGAEYRRNGALKTSSNAFLISSLIVVSTFIYPIITAYLSKDKNTDKISTVAPKVINYSQLSAPPPIDLDKPDPQLFQAPPKVKQVKFVQPVAKKDEEVDEEEYMPTMEELNDVEIGATNIDGVDSVIVDINSQVEVAEEIVEQAFAFAEVMPSFQGGDAALMRYLGENLKYPKIAKEANVEGVVFIQFVVEPDGTITNVNVVRGVFDALDQEAVRVIENMPTWKAGMQNGRKVRVIYTIPIRFDLQ